MQRGLLAIASNPEPSLITAMKGRTVMVQLVIFINLFFIPLLPLYVIYKKRRKPLEPNLDLLFQYGITAVCNIPLTKVFVFLLEKASTISISLDSGYYTVVALLPTVFFILLYGFCKVYPDHDHWREKIIQKGIKGVVKDIAPAAALLFVSCFMLFVFEPIVMYANNMDDFWFDFQIVIGTILRIFATYFLIGMAAILVIYTVDLLISKKTLLYKGITLIGFVIFLLVYLQGNWLAGALPTLEGEKIVWENYGTVENIVLVTAMVLLAAAIIASVRKRGMNRTVFYTLTCSLVIFVMLFTSLVTTVVTNKAFVRKEVFSPSLKNFNTVSSNKNFLIFLVDNVSSQQFYDVMMEDDDFRGMMDDFTYYPDAMGLYPQTRDSLVSILTGAVYRNETNFLDYSSRAYNQSPLFEKLTENGYEINLYSTSMHWNGERRYAVENASSIRDDSVDKNNFMEQEWKYILYKYLPYGLKQHSKIETLDFDACRIINSEYDGYSWGNKRNYKRITENSILDKQDQNYFHFIHCEGSHLPYNMDKNLKTVEEGTYDQKVAAALTMVKAYLQRLKDNNAYDNSVIVIMADHGTYPENGEQQPLRSLSRLNPALFIKGINEKHMMLESDRTVSYADLNDAFCKLIDGKQSTELFAELEPGRVRTVLWLRPGKEDHKVEYSTTGTAREPDKFIPTGNVYDLIK